MPPILASITLAVDPDETLKTYLISETPGTAGLQARQIHDATCNDLRKELIVEESKKPDKFEKTIELEQGKITFVTKDACAVCHNYEVLLENLLVSEYPGLAFEKKIVASDPDEQLPQLYLGKKSVDLSSEFNTLARARNLLHSWSLVD